MLGWGLRGSKYIDPKVKKRESMKQSRGAGPIKEWRQLALLLYFLAYIRETLAKNLMPKVA